MSRASERGAVAVEFAILAPVLIMILFGIMEFGRAYNAQISLSNAAREGVRVMSMSNDQTAAKTAAKNAAVGLTPAITDTNIAFSASNGTGYCTTSSTTSPQMTVTITYTLSTMTGVAGPFTMKGKGVMLCGG